MNIFDVELGGTYWVNTNHANLPAWAYKSPQVTVTSDPKARPGVQYVDVTDTQGNTRELHVSHLRDKPPLVGAPPSRAMPGPVHHIRPDAGEELALDLEAL